MLATLTRSNEVEIESTVLRLALVSFLVPVAAQQSQQTKAPPCRPEARLCGWNGYCREQGDHKRRRRLR